MHFAKMLDGSGTVFDESHACTQVTSPTASPSKYYTPFLLSDGVNGMSPYPKHICPHQLCSQLTLCRCPDPAVNGQCVDSSTVLATFSRLDSDSSITTQRCLVKPNYNLFTKSFWFSTCWRWSCLEPEFRGENGNRIKPYRIRCAHLACG